MGALEIEEERSMRQGKQPSTPAIRWTHIGFNLWRCTAVEDATGRKTVVADVQGYGEEDRERCGTWDEEEIGGTWRAVMAEGRVLNPKYLFKALYDAKCAVEVEFFAKLQPGVSEGEKAVVLKALWKSPCDFQLLLIRTGFEPALLSDVIAALHSSQMIRIERRGAFYYYLLEPGVFEIETFRKLRSRPARRATRPGKVKYVAPVNDALTGSTESPPEMRHVLEGPVAKRGRKPQDLTGRRFARLTVLSLSEKRIRGSRAWVCKCRCGTRRIVPTSHLRNGQVKRCRNCSGLAMHKRFARELQEIEAGQVVKI
jgi:hypothetical protein